MPKAAPEFRSSSGPRGKCIIAPPMNVKLVLAVLSPGMIFGCQSSQPRTTTTVTETTTVRQDEPPPRNEAATIRVYADRLQTSRTPAEEADTLRHLQQYMTDTGLTYNVKGQRASDGA